MQALQKPYTHPMGEQKVFLFAQNLYNFEQLRSKDEKKYAMRGLKPHSKFARFYEEPRAFRRLRPKSIDFEFIKGKKQKREIETRTTMCGVP